jgi:hypothetical protein
MSVRAASAAEPVRREAESSGQAGRNQRTKATEAAAKAFQTVPTRSEQLEKLQDAPIGIEGRASMNRDELITALREQR